MGSELLSCVQLFVSLWAAAHQAPLCPWNFPIRNTVVGCHFLLQGIFLTQGSNLCLSVLYWQVDSLPLSYLGSPMSRMAENHWRKCLLCLQYLCIIFLVYSKIFAAHLLGVVEDAKNKYKQFFIWRWFHSSGRNEVSLVLLLGAGCDGNHKKCSS